MTDSLRVAGLFAGIGGLELGLEHAGHHSVVMSENDPHASRVLQSRFPSVDLLGDVRDITQLRDADVVAAGFPCTDISQAGRRVGIAGPESGLVNEIFRLVESSKVKPEYILLENVSYLLRLARGRGMHYIVECLEELGYRWAYRIVDARAFGIPQRRQRVLFVASLNSDPRNIIFADDDQGEAYDDSVGRVDPDATYGFYWTEGFRGLGWTKDAVPTIKGGSGLGIPSAPGIWRPETGEIGTPQIEDGERIQGFPSDWTMPVELGSVKLGVRWKQIGNAVCVPMSEWLGMRLREPGTPVDGNWDQEILSQKWPQAAYGSNGRVFQAPVTMRPFRRDFSIQKFMDMPVKPLSARATAGFLSRARKGHIRFPDGFLDALEVHLLACS